MSEKTLLEKLDKIRQNPINIESRTKVQQKYDKMSYKRKLYSDKSKSISQQILEKYEQKREQFNLYGADKKSITINDNINDWIKSHNMKVTCDRIKKNQK